jgi:hypothetical protein
MGICTYCGAQESLPFKCKFCGDIFCSDHHLPENHDCQGLVRFKETRGKEPEKWIYEPFHEKYKARVGREVKKPFKEKIQELVKPNAKKIVYVIVAVILLITIYQALS